MGRSRRDGSLRAGLDRSVSWRVRELCGEGEGAEEGTDGLVRRLARGRSKGRAEGGGDDEPETGAVWMLATRAAKEIGRSSTAPGSRIFTSARFFSLMGNRPAIIRIGRFTSRASSIRRLTG